MIFGEQAPDSTEEGMKIRWKGETPVYQTHTLLRSPTKVFQQPLWTTREQTDLGTVYSEHNTETWVWSNLQQQRDLGIV